jgi:hypothetical protein
VKKSYPLVTVGISGRRLDNSEGRVSGVCAEKKSTFREVTRSREIWTIDPKNMWQRSVEFGRRKIRRKQVRKR